MRLRAVVLTAAIALAANGCGDAEEDAPGDPTAPARTYVQKSYVDDMVAACAQLTDEARVDVREIVSKVAGRHPAPDDCVGVLRLFQSFGAMPVVHAGVMDYALAQDQEPQKLAFETVEVDESTATGRVRGSDKTIDLVYRDGRWLIASLDFSDVP